MKKIPIMMSMNSYFLLFLKSKNLLKPSAYRTLILDLVIKNKRFWKGYISITSLPHNYATL